IDVPLRFGATLMSGVRLQDAGSADLIALFPYALTGDVGSGLMTILHPRRKGPLFGRLAVDVQGMKAIGGSLADFDGDGRLDMAVSSVGPNLSDAPGRIVLLKGTGDGSFQQSGSLDVGILPFGTATDDIDGDGKADLVVSNYFSSSVSVF